MSEPAAVHDRIGPGRLVLVVGPSGAGKDTLIGLAKNVFGDDRTVMFPRRIVTREASVFEDNEQVSRDAFAQAVARGDYAVHWKAHGHCYALPRSIDGDLRNGRTVVANVSRTVIGTMRHAYTDVAVVVITAPPDVLAERLAARARDSDGVVLDRLHRAVEDSASPDHIISNVGSADANAVKLVRIINGK